MLCNDGESWKMVTIDENKPRGVAPPFIQKVLKSSIFHIFILILVLANAITAATIHFDHNKVPENNYSYEGYYPEVSTVFIYPYVLLQLTTS